MNYSKLKLLYALKTEKRLHPKH